MIYSEYGNTGKKVSAVGFGGMRFNTEKDDQENADLVRFACSKGINYFDTAPGYCKDKSEDIFGLAFQDMPGEFLVSTKAMPTDFDTAEKAIGAVKKSIDRMGVEKIDFYHIWCLRKMEHYDLAMRPGGQYDGLRQCQEEGLIEHIVFSSHQPGSEIKYILDQGKVDGVLLGMNILNFPYRWEGVKAAAATGCGVVAMNPVGGGLIPQHEDQLQFLASEGETPTEAALRFNISCPEITVTLVGFSNREEIETACRIADNSQMLSDADLERIREKISGGMNEVCTACGYCEGCPQNIPIPAYMQFYNEKQMFGVSDETMIKRLPGEREWQMLAARKADAGDCVECRICEEKCTQHINIIERLNEIAGWEDQIEN